MKYPYERCLNPACKRFEECRAPSCCIADAEKDIWNEAIEAALTLLSNGANDATARGYELTGAYLRKVLDELYALKRQ